MSETPEKRAKLALLIDFYSALLSERQRQVMEMYFMEDMSLSEISDELGITRQGVHDALKKSEHQLIDTEEKLGLIKRFETTKNTVSVICERLEETEKEQNIDLSDIISLAKTVI